jgi:hypothetical protein
MDHKYSKSEVMVDKKPVLDDGPKTKEELAQLYT